MTDFADWDLTAVVGGYSAASLNDNDHDLLFGNFVFPEYLFDDINNYSNSDLELSDLYKPFYPPSNFDQYTLSPPTPQPPPLAVALPEEMVIVKDEEKTETSIVPDVVAAAADDRCSKATVGTKYRIRKNQQKRVVMEVTGEGLSLDMWAWRKYGQKPIKGSPYPRSYYRCSSSKGCPARKMVERSHLNPTTFIMTYTGDHNHAKPTRRNSLAGTTRQRFSPVPIPTCSEEKTIVTDHMMVIGNHHDDDNDNDNDDDRFVSALTSSKSNDVGFYQEHGDSSFW